MEGPGRGGAKWLSLGKKKKRDWTRREPKCFRFKLGIAVCDIRLTGCRVVGPTSVRGGAKVVKFRLKLVGAGVCAVFLFLMVLVFFGHGLDVRTI